MSRRVCTVDIGNTAESDILSGAADYFRRYHARTLSKAKLSEEILRSVIV